MSLTFQKSDLDSRHVTGVILGALGAALFSLKGIVMKLAFLEGANVEQMMALRMGIALPVFIFIGLRAGIGRAEPVKARFLVQAFLLGIISHYLCSWLDFTGLQFISAQFERLILFLYPTVTALLAWAFLGDRITWRHAVALLLSYAGVAILAFREVAVVGPHAAWGAFLVFIAAILFGSYVVAAKPVISKIGSPLFTSVAMSGAAVAILLHFGVKSAAEGLPEFSPMILVYGIILAVACTILPAFMTKEAIARIGPGPASAVGGFGPAATAFIAVLLLGEPFGWPQALALVLTVSGVLLLTRQKPPPGLSLPKA